MNDGEKARAMRAAMKEATTALPASSGDWARLVTLAEELPSIVLAVMYDAVQKGISQRPSPATNIRNSVSRNTF